MSIRALSDDFHVSAQIHPKDVPALAQAGYAAIIVMRPDREGFFQPSFAEMEKAAREANIAAHYLPVVPGAIDERHGQQLRDILTATTGKVLSYCASGNRCAQVYQLAQRR